MKNRIVMKLFLLTSGLCLFIILAIFIGQTLFFERFYAEKKVDQLTEAIASFRQEYLNIDEEDRLRQLEQDFYQEHNAWIVVLDENGNIKGTEDYFIELDRAFIFTDTSKRNTERKYIEDEPINIPIYYLINQEELIDQENILNEYPTVEVQGVKKEDVIYPFQLFWRSDDTIDSFFDRQGSYSYTLWENKQLLQEAEEFDEAPLSIYGHVKDIHIPDVTHSILSNPILTDKLKEFQINLLLDNNVETEVQDFEQDNIQYKLLVNPAKNSNGETIYFYTLASLQPVNEAVQMIKEYYIYIVLFAVALVLLAAFYYSKGIARPLLRINDATKSMRNLDFTERITVQSKDEIGELSNNINFLSTTLQSYIDQLQQDVEIERQLEQTRKDFIAGVSHELKTPLSIMKSCMAILQDGVATEKKDHYFNAMENEVNRMDRLIADMLELAKYESGTYKIEMNAFFIDELIRSVYNQLSLKVIDQQIDVNLNLHSVEVIANQDRVEQVITNFLSNAIQHTPDKGKIVVTTLSEEDKVKITVENEGSHIEEEQLEKIWDRFYQGEKSQRSKQGTGLGLAISKNILKLHHVPFGVINTKKGVCFYFYLNKK
ncbi:HAMP domain-containing protein [Gracilibacillus orientalis]|uniref:histidine kinase n=1 Tax=Gracilibacillus orientalis TaxID=334253 RepID=A0A1I4GUG9_9BACI|nr:ATP-binding protein [Gracilibacillus orientalis]SFL33160.1 HAMP domain-containing protein [Gracilibacillus orientalis]